MVRACQTVNGTGEIYSALLTNGAPFLAPSMRFPSPSPPLSSPDKEEIPRIRFVEVDQLYIQN